jgi:Rrf2 family iron-sulfur cluster assembly transcriptional regulator
MFSKACEYAIKATIYIAEQSLLDRRVSQKEVASAIQGPEAFTAKTLQKLAKSNVISSMKGPGGGFFLTTKQLQNIFLIHIVESIDGLDQLKACGLGLSACNNDKPCPVHFQYKVIKDGLMHMLSTTNIKDLALDIKRGDTFLTH